MKFQLKLSHFDRNKKKNNETNLDRKKKKNKSTRTKNRKKKNEKIFCSYFDKKKLQDCFVYSIFFFFFGFFLGGEGVKNSKETSR